MRRPALIGALAEPIRASGELATSAALAPFVTLLPPGDGHPVLLLPGFMATDSSTGPLRAFLISRGYRPYRWTLGRNIGPTPQVMDGLPARLNDVAQRSGQPVTVIGWSLGGMYARWLARSQTHQIRQVITLGTPVRREVANASNAQGLYEYLSPYHRGGLPALDEGRPLPIPCTALHTRSDGIVDWRTCLVETSENSHNVRVPGSHVGLGFNPAAMWVIAERLAADPLRWRLIQIPRALRPLIAVV